MNYRLMIYFLIMGFASLLGGIALMGWGAYVACADGGGHLLNGWRPAFVCISDNVTIPLCTLPGQQGYFLQPQQAQANSMRPSWQLPGQYIDNLTGINNTTILGWFH